MEALQRAKLDGFDGLSLWELSLSAVVVWTGTPPIKSSGVPLVAARKFANGVADQLFVAHDSEMLPGVAWATGGAGQPELKGGASMPRQPISCALG
jgi:hypothetical protein